MGLKQKIASIFNLSRKSPLDVSDFDVGRPVRVEASNPSNPEIIQRISWVFACVRIISQAVKRTPLRIYRGNSDIEVTKGPLADILRRPNPFMSGKQLLEGTQFWLEIHGNSYWYLSEMNAKKQPLEIWLLDSRCVSVVPDRKNLVQGYIYDVNGKQIALNKDEVIHFKTFNPFNPFYGMGTIQYNASLFSSEIYREEYDKSFFENGAVLSGVFQTEQTLSDNVIKRLRKEWKKMHQGAKNSHKVAFLDSGLQFKETTLSQRDMQFLEMAKFNRDRIFAAFGVPPAKLGIMESANYSNSEEQDKTFWSETMAPKLSDIEERLTNELAPRYGDYIITFEDVVKEDESKKVSEVVALANASVPILTPNELRSRLGYAPVAGWDDIDHPEQAEPDNQEEKTKAFKSVKDSFQRSRTAYLARVVKVFEQDLIVFFAEQEKRVLEALRNTGGKTGKSYNFIPDELWDMYTEDEQLKAVLSVLHITVARAAYEKAGTWFDRDIRFDLDDPKNRELLDELGQKITRINETTRQAIVKEVTEGMRRGYSINQIAYGFEQENYKGIQGVFAQATNYRARMIARSESADAYNAANLKAYTDLGQNEVEVLDGIDWDEECRKANGEIWPITHAMLNLKDHPNCTRAFAPHIDILEKTWEEEGPAWFEMKKKAFN